MKKCYIGDPCYVIRGETWDKIVKDYYKEHPHHTVNGHECYIFATAYGDGEYALKDGTTVVASLGVDAGVIGAVPVEAVTHPENLYLGYVADINLSSDTCKSNNGNMRFDFLTVDTGSNDLAYEEWLNEVNRHVRDRAGGFGIEDLIDYNTRAAYDEGMEPEEAAEALIEHDGTFF